MKLLIAFILISMGVHSLLAESLLQSPRGQQFLLDVKAATAENDMLSPSFEEEILQAQIRIASMGSRADEMLAQMTREEITLWRSGEVNGLTGGTQGIPPSNLIFLVSYDPEAPKLLLDPLMSWVDAAAASKIQNAADITQRAALYINKWGTPEQKARVKADTETMLKSADYETRSGGVAIQGGLKGSEIGNVPRNLGGPFSDYCSWAASYRQHIRSKEPLPPVEVRSHWRLEQAPEPKTKPAIAKMPLTAPPAALPHNSVWLILGGLGLGGGIWLVLRRKAHRGSSA